MNLAANFWEKLDDVIYNATRIDETQKWLDKRETAFETDADYQIALLHMDKLKTKQEDLKKNLLEFVIVHGAEIGAKLSVIEGFHDPA